MDFATTVTALLTQGLRNGMTPDQIRDRFPGFAARRLGITEADFHAQLEAIETAEGFDGMIRQVVESISPAERDAALKRAGRP